MVKMNETKYKLTIFKNRFQSSGKQMEKTFEEIYNTFKHKVKRTPEKYAEYQNADKQTKATIKDVGGFVGGETEGNLRRQGVRITRQLLTLDIDTHVPHVLNYLMRNVTFYCFVHSTHSHSPDENRFRIIAPLSRPVTEDEYEALGRKIAYSIEYGQDETMKGLFDETTFQANRLMFFPSVSSDGEYVCEMLNLDLLADEQAVINVDEILAHYVDYNNVIEWFRPDRVDDEQSGRKSAANKKPLKAKGLVGAFNRTYTISQAIERFLPHIYKKESNNRYTFIGGESHNGALVLNDDTIFYSHHGTDPANLYYRSAFDLVRIHMFGKFDTKSFTPEKEIEKEIAEKNESFEKMIDFCRTLPEVVAQSESNIALHQRLEQQKEYIGEHFDEKNEEPESKSEETTAPQEEAEKDTSWLMRLDGIKSTFGKLDLIFSNDDQIGNLFYYDTFRDNICFAKKPYWHRDFLEGTALQDKDTAHIRAYLDRVYGIKGERIIDDAIIVEADKVQKNRVLEHFNSLVWDGEERIEHFFHNFFKVPYNPFTRTAFKHWLVGAVSRIYRAGAPMDLLLVIKGEQGIGKSLFFKRLATLDFKRPTDHLYSDTKIDFNNAKDSYEQLEGIWIFEWKELAGMNMSEQESIKAFVDKTEDKFRRSYGRRNVEIKRRVAFGGTTNALTPLRDRTGNRRFLVLESPLARNECYIKDETLFTQEYKNQLIAEAIHLYKNNYDIFHWTDEELEYWERSNEDNLAENDLLGAIQAYLTMRRPRTWYSMTIEEMTAYYDTYDFVNDRSNSYIYKDSVALDVPDRLCIQEIWKVPLKQRDLTINKYHRELIVQALTKLGWQIKKVQQRFGKFGHQLPVEKIAPKQGGDEDDLPF